MNQPRLHQARPADTVALHTASLHPAQPAPVRGRAHDVEATREERASELLAELRIDRLRKQRATSLSGGERRRLEIARALATDPSFILLDEPFAGIDPLAIADIRDLIGFLKQRGIGVLITDHNVRDTLNIIDRATIIFDGEVLFEGSPDEVLNQPDVRRVYLGADFKA